YIPVMDSTVKVFDNQVTYLDDVSLIPETGERDGSVCGYISDSVTGERLAGVQITFYPGWNNTSDIPEKWVGKIVTCTTNASGYYSAELIQGGYTAVMTKVGYIQGSMNVISVQDMTGAGRHNGVLSPLQASDQYRVVLTWAAEPSDLDSHLTGKLDDGSSIHVYYSEKTAEAGNSKLADLDLDDTDSYGPETVTIYLPDSGSFRYSVHDYTNRNDASSSMMSRSNAKVTVYKGNECIATYPVPNKAGTVWTVFDLNGGVITPVNAMTFVSDPDDVGSFSTLQRMMRTVEWHEDNKNLK
ncbi:YfaP family protein, partial [Paenibacillus sp.]